MTWSGAEVVQVVDKDGRALTQEEIGELIGKTIVEVIRERVAAEIRRLKGRVD